MTVSNKGLPIAKVKETDLVNYLAELGYRPDRISQHNYWYRSPLRHEKTASFKVNRNLNRWYDFAEGRGGNLIDFGILYHRCSVSDFLQKLDGSLSLGQQPPSPKTMQVATETSAGIKVLKEDSIHSLALVRYLHTRRIPLNLAQQFCREITYELNGKNYYAIGFKNRAGGYELRNEYFKGSSSPKDITLMDNQFKEMAVFEGFFNFLSYQAICQKLEQPQRNCLILNSVSFFERAKPLMLTQEVVHLYLDRDTTGQNCTQKALQLGRQFKDESSLYRTHKDLNDWMMHIGQSQQQGIRNRNRSFP
jgi:hypothetical protein